MKEIKAENLPGLFQKVADEFAAAKDELCAMDANMGDGDLGLTMQKGFAALPDIVRGCMSDDIGATLSKSGMKMASTVPSTMGTLMASGIMGAGVALKGKASIDAEGLASYIKAFADGVKRRGKCERGNRTIYDALAAAADKAAELPLDGAASIDEVIAAAVEGAEAGVEATKSMKPVFGKAAVFADKAAGIPDQGAVAALHMLKAMKAYIDSM